MSGNSLSCKIVLLGDARVGKTSLRRTFFGEGFQKPYEVTIGADFAAKRFGMNDKKEQNWMVTSNIWDLSGQNKFKIIRETYYKGVSGALMVYDIARQETFDSITTWINELVDNNKGHMVPMVIIANKADLKEELENTIPVEKGQELAIKLTEAYDQPVQFIEASAKTGHNVGACFEMLIAQIFDDFVTNVLKQ